MPTIIVYDSGAINFVQPEISGTPEGTLTSLFVDANLNQYTTGAHGTSCSDVDGLTLWTVSQAQIEAMFIAAGASDPVVVGTSGVLLSPDGQDLLFWMQATSVSTFYMYLGTSPIPDTGDVGPPALTDYLRMVNATGDLFTPVACFDMGEPGDGLVFLTRDFSADKSQMWVCPSVQEIADGMFKGAHPGCTGVLASDQGPAFYVTWSSSDAFRTAYGGSVVQSGTVDDSPIGFMAEGKFWFVTPKAWMQNSGSGLGSHYGATFPDGAVFYIPFSYGIYRHQAWPALLVTDTDNVTRDAVDGSALFSPALPWTEEYTRLSDGGANDGWLASYQGRPAVVRDGDDVLLFFGIIDGNATYEDDVGAGDRIYYAKVRGYRWTGGAFSQFDAKSGIILTDGDLGFTGYNFDAPDSQHVFVYAGQIYFQICQFTAMASSRSVLTQFGEYREIVPVDRASQAIGRVRLVPAQARF